MAVSKKYTEYWGSDMDNYSADREMWKNLTESTSLEERKEIVKKFMNVILSKHSLHTRERTAYIMKYHKMMSNEEISVEMRVTIKAVRNYIYRANKKIAMISKEIKNK